MSTIYVLYNKKAGAADDYEKAKTLENETGKAVERIDVATISDYKTFLDSLNGDDSIILAGGDGTINCFINNIEGLELKNEVLYYPNGTGNDFAHELGYEKNCKPFSINEYIKDLPVVTVKGKTYRFINGVGYGIDGYCCEVGDELRKIPGKKVNYTAIAIKGLLFHYKPTNAKVIVDGKEYTYKKVWLAPTMNGKFYGGGMMPTPNQQRGSGLVSTMLFFGTGKLRTLMIFPTLFKGEHVNRKKNVAVFTGKEVTVEFDRPVALQIDGETILNVSSYTAKIKAKENATV